MALTVTPAQQNAAISSATRKYGVPLNVFMGMYSVETGSGSNVTNSSAGAVGPFQFTSPDKGTGVLYPMTNTPTVAEFQQQADAAAALLKNLFNTTGKSWATALAAYNAGPGNIPAGAGYAQQALAAGAHYSNAVPPGGKPIAASDPNSLMNALGAVAGPAGAGVGAVIGAVGTATGSLNPGDWVSSIWSDITGSAAYAGLFLVLLLAGAYMVIVGLAPSAPRKAAGLAKTAAAAA